MEGRECCGVRGFTMVALSSSLVSIRKSISTELLIDSDLFLLEVLSIIAVNESMWGGFYNRFAE
jgi:hypothetical protein